MNKQVEAAQYQDSFKNVMALFVALNARPNQSIRRAELKQGEVIAEAVDFLSDVSIKARRTLTPHYYTLLLILAADDKYEQFPIDLQCQLGQVFKEKSLDYDGDYRVLFYRAKNNQLHDRVETEPMHFPEEPMNAEDILSE